MRTHGTWHASKMPSKAQKNPVKSTDQDFRHLLDQLDAQRSPTFQCADILRQLYEKTRLLINIDSQNRMDLLLSLQSVINSCVEDNPTSEAALKWCDLIILHVKQTKNKNATLSQPPPEEEQISIKTCRKMLDLIVCEYKQKWKLDRQNNYPTMRSKNSASGKKVVKSMVKYETYLIKAMWNRWLIFAKKLDRIKDEKDMQKVLSSTLEFLTRIDEVLGKQSGDVRMRRDRRDERDLYVEELHPIEDDRQQEIEESLKVEPETMAPENDWFLSGTNPFQMQPEKGHFTMPIYESPNPNSSTASAQVLSKNFIDLNMVSLQELCDSMDTNDEANFDLAEKTRDSWDLDKLWKGNQRWMQIKHNLIQKGVLLMKGLHISLPVHRSEFLIGKGNFGHVEFAFSHQFYGIALKRLTEYGKVSARRCDGVRRALDELKQHTMVNASVNLLRSVGFQDMCGYTFSYTMICDYNLTEYLEQLTGEIVDEVILEEKKRDMIGQMVNGLGALHLGKKAIVHGNLKPTNVLVTVGGVVKLAEFGIYSFLYDCPANISSSDKLWWPEETHTWLKMLKVYSCTTMSDIYSLGLLLLYVQSNGQHPSLTDQPQLMGHMLENIKSGISIEQFNLIGQMIYADALQRPSILEVHNHIYFWSHEKRASFLQTCISVANTDFTPYVVDRQVAQSYCANLEQIWSKDNTKMFWMAAAFMHFGSVEAQFGAKVDSALGLLKFLGKCKNDNIALFSKPGLLRRAYPALACIVYNAMRSTNWFEHDQFEAFSPAQPWRPVEDTAKGVDLEKECGSCDE